VHEPFIRVVAREPGSHRGRPLRPSHAALFLRVAADVIMPMRSLAVDPKLLPCALRYYHSHPDARFELDNAAAIRRIRHGEIRWTHLGESTQWHLSSNQPEAADRVARCPVDLLAATSRTARVPPLAPVATAGSRALGRSADRRRTGRRRPRRV
jgi:hypothetical protein